MGNEIYIYGLIVGAYFALTLMLGFNLTFDFFQSKKGYLTPFMKMCGITILLDGMAILFGEIISLIPAFEYAGKLIRLLFDALVLVSFISAGLTLIKGTFVKYTTMLNIFVPYVIEFLFCSLFDVPQVYALSIYAIYSIGVMAWLSIRLFKHDQLLKFYYSNTENRSTKWYVVFVSMFVVEIVFWYIIMYYKNIYTFSIYSVYMICMWVIVARMSVSQKLSNAEAVNIEILQMGNKPDLKTLEPNKDIAEHAEQESDSVSSNDSDNVEQKTNDDEYGLTKMPDATSAIDKDISEELCNRFLDFVEYKKAYLDPDLSVEKVVRELNTNTTYLYFIMRDHFNVKFYDFINTYRVEEAKKLMIETDSKMEFLAQDCGFNSGRAFSRVFKAYTGMSPREWKIAYKDQLKG